jgi:hypothetical protein
MAVSSQKMETMASYGKYSVRTKESLMILFLKRLSF